MSGTVITSFSRGCCSASSRSGTERTKSSRYIDGPARGLIDTASRKKRYSMRSPAMTRGWRYRLWTATATK